ncbi:hypothetical protein HKX48_002377 [Thoreauomyces humboldtii]|nr:hypothetical protein HKX48_002377 [Thoreauomyces humboldtii]
MQGFVLPNEDIGRVPLEDFATPLDAIERAAGLVFFPNVNRLGYAPLCRVTKCQVRDYLVAANKKMKKLEKKDGTRVLLIGSGETR